MNVICVDVHTVSVSEGSENGVGVMRVLLRAEGKLSNLPNVLVMHGDDKESCCGGGGGFSNWNLTSCPLYGVIPEEGWGYLVIGI